jgi:hypothetical protein
MASTAVLSAKVVAVDSGEVSRSTVYSRYNNGHRTLPWGMSSAELCVLSFKLYMKVSPMQDFPMYWEVPFKQDSID